MIKRFLITGGIMVHVGGRYAVWFINGEAKAQAEVGTRPDEKTAGPGLRRTSRTGEGCVKDRRSARASGLRISSPATRAVAFRPDPTRDPLYLFLSDLHLGRGTPDESRAAERDALALLDAHEDAVRVAVSDTRGGGLYLVGDVFDQFIEYRRLVPKGFARLQGRLAAWTDAGLPVTYLVGNRDPWHLDYFESELGVRLVRGGTTERLAGHTAYLAHGDGRIPSERAYNLLKPILRHPLAYRLYRTLLPGDSGYRLARRIARMGSGAPEASTVRGLRASAQQLLSTTSADLVVFGHGHAAELDEHPGGMYLNPGYWFADRTFARLDADGPALLRWTGRTAEPFSPTFHETNME